jgi:uroporphyrinogen decarboxylase
MRQAGRYLPEFRKLRETHDFFTMCTTPELAAEVTLQPLERFDLDAVILFSDILVIPQGLGFHVEMQPSLGPVFTEPMQDPAQLASRVLEKSAESVTKNLDYVYKGVQETRRRLKARVPLIGFAGAPWTLMCYMVDGSGEEKKKEKFGIAINWLYEHPEAATKLLTCLAEHVANHLIQQAQAGCHLLQLFDSWAGLLPPGLYRKFGLPALQSIIQKVKAACPSTPVICFAKGAHALIEELSLLPFDALSIDWTSDLSQARKQAGGRVTLQGNMDPLALFAKPEVIVAQVKEMLTSYGTDQQGYIANLGHGCLPSYKPEHVGVFIDAVHSISAEMIKSHK